MKIEAKGQIKAKFAEKYQTNDGSYGIKATIVVKTGENNGYENLTIYQTRKQELIEKLKEFKIGDKVECVGFLNGYYGKKGKKEYGIININLSEISLQEEKKDEPDVEGINISSEDQNEDLPF